MTQGYGLKLSPLSLGTLHFGAFVDAAVAEGIIVHAFENGIHHFDCAPMYGEGQAETILGRAVRPFRAQVVISTKVGLQAVQHAGPTFTCERVKLTAATIHSSVAASLSALHTDYIDVLVLHAFDYETPLAETVDALVQLVQAGKVLHVGCSNFSPQEVLALDAALREYGVRLALCQVHYNMIERKAGYALQSVCSASNISMVCNRALARGLLSGKYKAGQPLPPQSRATLSNKVYALLTPESLQLVAALDAYAQSLPASLTAVAIAWLLQQQTVGSVLVGVRNCKQLEACITAMQLILPNDFVAEIDDVVSSQGAWNRVHALPELYLS